MWPVFRGLVKGNAEIQNQRLRLPRKQPQKAAPVSTPTNSVFKYSTGFAGIKEMPARVRFGRKSGL